VGTKCEFQAAATDTDEYCEDDGDCECFLRDRLEYSSPQYCNVSSSVQFNHLYYNTSEGSSLELCVTANGHGFDVVLETAPVTATGKIHVHVGGLAADIIYGSLLKFLAIIM